MRGVLVGHIGAVAIAVLAVVAPAQAHRFVYVANEGSEYISQYRVGAGGLLAPLSPPTVASVKDLQGVAVSPDGLSVYVGNPDFDGVSQYDLGPEGRLSPKSPPIAAAGDDAVAVALEMRESGRGDNDLLDRLAADERLGVSRADLDVAIARPLDLAGTAGQQVAVLTARLAELAAAHPEAAAYRPGLVL